MRVGWVGPPGKAGARNCIMGTGKRTPETAPNVESKPAEAKFNEFRKAPIIIGGCPRSGTSLLLTILSAHPNIFTIQEEAWAFYDTHDMAEFSSFLDRWLWPRIPAGTEAYYHRWCEKTPGN